ncbi:MAG TPA: leucyl/phenylalanyl-tRNA--protein transferase [Bacteroidota bacterium]|jgi:leucyl/phenylalanyl-tRNA--protein transferase
MKHPHFNESLSVEFLLLAYSNGYFPMADVESGEIRWYSPDPRSIIPFKQFKPQRSLRQIVKKNLFEVRVDTACEAVIRSCAKRENSWISEEIVVAYTVLHRAGHVHSVESWREGRLVGGLYGVSIGAAFFGESMFSSESNASKVAFVHLVEILKIGGYEVLDTQFANEHMAQFGIIDIPRERYLFLLSNAIQKRARFESRE